MLARSQRLCTRSIVHVKNRHTPALLQDRRRPDLPPACLMGALHTGWLRHKRTLQNEKDKSMKTMALAVAAAALLAATPTLAANASRRRWCSRPRPRLSWRGS